MHDTVRALKTARINCALFVSSAIIDGMKADNAIAAHKNEEPPYDGEEFMKIAGELERQVDSIMKSDNDY